MKNLQTIGGEIAVEYPEGMGFTSEDLSKYLLGMSQPFKSTYYPSSARPEDIESWSGKQNIAASAIELQIGSEAFSNLMPRAFKSEDPKAYENDIEIKYTNLPKPEPLEDSTKIPVAQVVLQRELEIVQINATEQELHNYKGIPPFKVVHAMANAWRSGKFDKMVVVDVEEKKLELPAATKPLVIDPLFACKMSEHPDRYYLLAGWLEDISLAEFVKDLALGGRTVPDVIQLLPENNRTIE